MQVRIFGSRSRPALQEAVNKFLQENPVSPDSMRFQFSAVVLDDPDIHIIEYVLVLFYVPMRAI